MPKKQSTPKLSTLAARILDGKKATKAEIERLAACVLGQDETKGQGKKKPKK